MDETKPYRRWYYPGRWDSLWGNSRGEPLYRYYGYVVDYIIETQEQADNAMYDNSAKAIGLPMGKMSPAANKSGDYEWKTVRAARQKDGKDYIDSQDQFLLGYTVPHSTGGLNNNFTYKNFTLNIFVDWALGHSINNNSRNALFHEYICKQLYTD